MEKIENLQETLEQIVGFFNYDTMDDFWDEWQGLTVVERQFFLTEVGKVSAQKHQLPEAA